MTLERMNRHLLINALVMCFTLTLPTAFVSAQEKVEFSGFARLIGGYLDDDNARYQGYSDNISFSQQSLIGVQADISINDTLDVSGQLLAHSGDNRDSGLEWLYLTYQPTQSWQFKVGKLRTPFLRFSDVLDVGFTYPWISAPQQLYNGYFFSEYDGGNARYYFDIGSVNLSIEAYYGVFEGEYDFQGSDIAIDVDAIQGGVITARLGNLDFRLSHAQSSDFGVDIPELSAFATILESAGFQQSARALRFDGKVSGTQLGVNYDTLDYFIVGEYSKLDSDLITVPSMDSFYVSAGYNIDVFQVYANYAYSNPKYESAVNTIPLGLSQEVDQLSIGFEQLVQSLPVDKLNSATIGLRWDFRFNMAAKVELTKLHGKANANSFFRIIDNDAFDRKATLYQVGLEWVF